MPSNQILILLAIFLTFFVISPVWKQVNENALQPYLAETISGTEAYTEALRPVRHFMMNLTRDKDLMLFIRFADEEKSMTADDILPQALVPRIRGFRVEDCISDRIYFVCSFFNVRFHISKVKMIRKL